VSYRRSLPTRFAVSNKSPIAAFSRYLSALTLYAFSTIVPHNSLSLCYHFGNMSYNVSDNRPRSSSNKYIPENYNYYGSSPGSPSRNGPSYLSPEQPQSRPFTPPSPAQYNASPNYRLPAEQMRPANPDVQAVQHAEGYGRRSESRERRPSHTSMHSRHSHQSHRSSRPVDERPTHERQGSHRSHRSSHSHNSSHHRKSGDQRYRTESEREEYINELKRIDSTRPT
jgi:hypothetical protein